MHQGTECGLFVRHTLLLGSVETYSGRTNSHSNGQYSRIRCRGGSCPNDHFPEEVIDEKVEEILETMDLGKSVTLIRGGN